MWAVPLEEENRTFSVDGTYCTIEYWHYKRIEFRQLHVLYMEQFILAYGNSESLNEFKKPESNSKSKNQL